MTSLIFRYAVEAKHGDPWQGVRHSRHARADCRGDGDGIPTNCSRRRSRHHLPLRRPDRDRGHQELERHEQITTRTQTMEIVLFFWPRSSGLGRKIVFKIRTI